MGQVLQKDRIGTLSESSGNITLSSSVLTIGGQQYSTNSLLVAADLSAANTRYQIYAVLNSGVVELVVSANENSAGPSGYTTWKLVGSYMSSAIGSFMSFINITGSPKTEGWKTIDLGSPEGSWISNVVYEAIAKFDNGTLKIQELLTMSGTPTAAVLTLNLPTNISIKTSEISSTETLQGLIPNSQCTYLDSGTSKTTDSQVEYVNDTVVRPSYAAETGGTVVRNVVNASSPYSWASGDKLQINYEVPVNEFPTKPIEDL